LVFDVVLTADKLLWSLTMCLLSRAKAVLGPSKLNMETSKEKQMKLIEKVEISGNSGFPILRVDLDVMVMPSSTVKGQHQLIFLLGTYKNK